MVVAPLQRQLVRLRAPQPLQRVVQVGGHVVQLFHQLAVALVGVVHVALPGGRGGLQLVQVRGKGLRGWRRKAGWARGKNGAGSRRCIIEADKRIVTEQLLRRS